MQKLCDENGDEIGWNHVLHSSDEELKDLQDALLALLTEVIQEGLERTGEHHGPLKAQIQLKPLLQ